MVEREKRKDKLMEQAGGVFASKILPALADRLQEKLLPAKSNGASNGVEWSLDKWGGPARVETAFLGQRDL